MYGDLPITITRQRAFGCLTLYQKVKFAWHILSTGMKIRLVACFVFYGIILIEHDNNTLPLIPISELLSKSDFVFVEFIYVGVIFYDLQYAYNLLNYYHSMEDVEKFKDKDRIEKIQRAMRRNMPNLARVLIDERDIVLAHSIKRSTKIQLGPEGKILCLVCQIKST